MYMHTPTALSMAVAAIYPDIQSQVEPDSQPTEKKLWWELSVCILGSQVPYSLAVTAADAVAENDFLLDRNIETNELMEQLSTLLSSPLDVEGNPRKYRFPHSKSKQLAMTHSSILRNFGSISCFLGNVESAEAARLWLIKNAPGMGPKQASMFIRNVGFSYDLAILDRHVLNYMSAIGIHSNKASFVSTISQYTKCESALKRHADDLNCSVGLLDWAIWIVMRVANRTPGVSTS